MPREEKDSVVPSFGYVVDNTVDYTPPKADPPAPATPPAPPEQPTVPGTSADAGEAKPGEAKPGDDKAAPAAADKPGEVKPDPNNELLSGIAQTLQQITAKLDKAPAGTEQQPQGEDPAVVLDRQLSELQQKAVNGEITNEEMLGQSAPLLREQARLAARQELDAERQQGQVQAAQGQFLQDYPDFEAFVGSPEAQQFVQTNPVFDHVSAFFAAREQKALQENQALQSQVAQLQEQIQKSIKNAATEQSAIVGEGGSDVGVPSTYRGDGLAPQQGGLAALHRARKQL